MARILESEDDLSRFNLERGWHWFARRYADGRWSPNWHTTRDAARRGLRGVSAELWGYDEKTKRWVKDSWKPAGRYV
jgi:hypothetical protein